MLSAIYLPLYSPKFRLEIYITFPTSVLQKSVPGNLNN
jgi:hypothetical protein